jgi:protein-S-isoprenylcysteine O-methyltransferase Ste14
MDPINLLVAINLFVSMTANWGGARKGLKTSITKVVDRPDTFLQKYPPNVAMIVLLLIILSIFEIGILGDTYKQEYYTMRLIGLGLFVVFSWVQVAAYKSLGKSYAQDIVILKDHKLCTSGLYKFIRHPQYLSQFLSDLGAGIALMSFLVIPAVILVEFPLFILRAKEEERLLEKHFKNEFAEYRKKSGFIIPFIG